MYSENVDLGHGEHKSIPDVPKRMQFCQDAIRPYFSTPVRNASLSDAGEPALPMAGFEHSLSDEAYALCCEPLESASQARRAPQPGSWRSRKHEPEHEYEALREVAR